MKSQIECAQNTQDYVISILAESVYPNVMRTRWMSELEFNEKSENERVESKQNGRKEKSAIRHIEIYLHNMKSTENNVVFLFTYFFSWKNM